MLGFQIEAIFEEHPSFPDGCDEKNVISWESMTDKVFNNIVLFHSTRKQIIKSVN